MVVVVGCCGCSCYSRNPLRIQEALMLEQSGQMRIGSQG